MKIILSIFIAALFVPMVSVGQTRLTMAEVGEVMVLAQKGKDDKALEKINSLRKTVTIKDSLYIYLILTSAQLNGKAYHCEEAIRDNEELIKLAPSLEAEAQMYIGQFKRLIGDFDGSIAAYSRVINLDRSNESVYTNLANTYNNAGRYRDAIRILDSSPYADHAPIEYYQYSVAYFNLNKLDSAKRCINKYLVDSGSLNDFAANKLAAQICDGLGLKKVSCEFINIALDIMKQEKTEQKIDDAPAKMKEYYFFKQMLKEIDSAKEIKAKVCG